MLTRSAWDDTKRTAIVLGIGAALCGCVAPEEPEASRTAVARPAARPASSAAGRAAFEDAPVPNRRVAPSTGESVIHIAK